MVTTAIKGHRLNDYLFRTIPCPLEFNPIEVITTRAIGFGLHPNSNYEEWTVSDKLLMGWLYGSMTEEVGTRVMGSTSLVDLWKALKNL
ncbi:hypothetical protein Ddye_024385 [Dipteronia dyeriana]|uniref:Uncharacterized protein n=1 Tax=Dipteronia dyeriana TaxID=168575 RepID=A0AAD9TUU5_9ROSI|nr:hypothetical protein Ddye_024385 [Dipteronia dyeriana]